MENASALRVMKACALLLVASLAFAPLQVTGYITLIKAEADQDYHIVLADDAGRTMIVGTKMEMEFKRRTRCQSTDVTA